MANQIFQTEKPIVAMVHLQYKKNLNQLIEDSLRDIEKLEEGGVDGLLFENWGDDYSDRHSLEEIKENIITVINEALKRTKRPCGVNVLLLDYEADFNTAIKTNVNFIQIDTFVDRVRTDYNNRFVLQVRPQEIIDYRKRLNLESVALFTNIQTKHYTTIPSNKKLETSVIQAIQNGADYLVITGKLTGEKTLKEKIFRVKRISGEVPVFIGSGFDISNAEELLPYANGVIVGTSLKYGGITENPVDETRVKTIDGCC